MNTQKIAINKCFGGFGLSHKAVLRYAEINGIKLFPEESYGIWHYYKVPKAEYDKATTKSLETYGNYTGVNSQDLYLSVSDIKRDDPILIQVINELGKEADSRLSKLKIVEIPEGIKWEIDEYDGMESIHEIHQSWD